MKYNGVIFDLDGTLLDTIGDILGAVNSAITSLGYREVTCDQLRDMIGDGAATMISRAIGSDEPCKAEPALKRYKEIYAATTGATKPFCGITELLAFLDNNGVKTAVLSNKPIKDAVAICGRIFSHKFVTVIGECEQYPVKPDTQGIMKIVSDFDLPISECLYVGDGEMDFLTPHKVGMRCVSALWGYRTREQLEKVGATEFAERPEDILKYLV